jgi:hypothetical protein
MGSLPMLATRSCVSPEGGTGARRSTRYFETEPLRLIAAKDAAAVNAKISVLSER